MPACDGPQAAPVRYVVPRGCSRDGRRAVHHSGRPVRAGGRGPPGGFSVSPVGIRGSIGPAGTRPGPRERLRQSAAGQSGGFYRRPARRERGRPRVPGRILGRVGRFQAGRKTLGAIFGLTILRSNYVIIRHMAGSKVDMYAIDMVERSIAKAVSGEHGHGPQKATPESDRGSEGGTAVRNARGLAALENVVRESGARAARIPGSRRRRHQVRPRLLARRRG
jgi:hypothetical protein